MGQYHYVVNLDRGEFLNPYRFAHGAKLMEFGPSGDGPMMALAILLARDNGQGGGDFDGKTALVGSWAGSRIAICGDYGLAGDLVPENVAGRLFKRDRDEVEVPGSALNVYELCALGAFKDISDDMIRAIQQSSERDCSDLRHINLSIPTTRGEPGFMSRFEQVQAGARKDEAAKMLEA